MWTDSTPVPKDFLALLDDQNEGSCMVMKMSGKGKKMLLVDILIMIYIEKEHEHTFIYLQQYCIIVKMILCSVELPFYVIILSLFFREIHFPKVKVFGISTLHLQ